MPLSAGDKLGPYEILAPLGAGGMGEVYRARDSKLNRDVAIKTLPAPLANDTQYMARFEREAQMLAALNHPNIAGIYGIEQGAIVMELVEGADLKGPLPVEEAIGIARQIAAGLEAAHEKGIIHRDLKPANIKLTPAGVVKILDFGLAKSTGESSVAASGSNPTMSPTLSMEMTRAGVILGTAAYMSPEQARAKVVDKRTDIWAFGVVLYELLTGKMLFGGSKNISDVLAAVLTREPDFHALPKATPPRVRRLLEHCLRKDPKQRLRDVGDARLMLDEPEPEALAPSAPVRRRLWAAGGVGFALLAAFAWSRWPSERPTGPFQRVQITKLTDSGKASAAAISPDGKYVVHAVTDEGKSSLWLLHAATGSNVQILPAAPGSFSNLNFSRDGNSLYYVFVTGKATPAMYIMPVLGGNARMLAAVAGRPGFAPAISSMEMASLSPDEKHLALTRESGGGDGLFLVNLDGSGERQLVARKSPDFLGLSAWSPDGKTVAYGVGSNRGGLSSGLAVTAVEGGPERLIGSRIWYFIRTLAWLPDGHGLVATANAQFPLYQVWYVGYPGGQVRRITNDLNNYIGLSLTGDAGALVTIQNETTSHLWVVAPGDSGSAREISTGRLDGLSGITWVGTGNIYFEAPDSSQTTQIWITAADGTGRRQITTEGLTGKPAPCGDDRSIVFLSYRAGTPHIWRSDLDGGNVRQLTNGEGEWGPSCSPDGSWLTYESPSAPEPKNRGIWRMSMDGGASVQISDRAGWARISPDGKSILVGDRANVSIIPAGGGQPIGRFDPVSDLAGSGVVQWSAGGDAVLYVKTVAGVSNVWRRPLDGGEAKPLTAFTTERLTAFAVSRDGKRLALARGKTSSDVVLIKDLK